MAEWLGTGLQNRLQQFDSARYLNIKQITVGKFIPTVFFIHRDYVPAHLFAKFVRIIVAPPA